TNRWSIWRTRAEHSNWSAHCATRSPSTRTGTRLVRRVGTTLTHRSDRHGRRLGRGQCVPRVPRVPAATTPTPNRTFDRGRGGVDVEARGAYGCHRALRPVGLPLPHAPA